MKCSTCRRELKIGDIVYPDTEDICCDAPDCRLLCPAVVIQKDIMLWVRVNDTTKLDCNMGDKNNIGVEWHEELGRTTQLIIEEE